MQILPRRASPQCRSGRAATQGDARQDQGAGNWWQSWQFMMFMMFMRSWFILVQVHDVYEVMVHNHGSYWFMMFIIDSEWFIIDHGAAWSPNEGLYLIVMVY